MNTFIYMGALALMAVVAASLGVAIIRRWAGRARMLDVPNERSSHTRPTPRGGGLAIVVVVLVVAWIVTLNNPAFSQRAMAALTLGALLIAGVSWRDDMRPVPFWVRLLVHGLGACVAMTGIGIIRKIAIPFGMDLPLGWLGFPLTLVWIVGLTNAYNFMDGIDGIAGGQAVVAGAGWAILGWIGGQPMVGIMGLLIAAASIGFLGHNWPPARIFMGDVGSAFLGFSFAALTILASQSDPIFVLAGIALIWPFIFDTVFTFFRRLYRGEKVWVAHRSHLYQRLVISGLSHGQVSGLYIGLATLGLVWAVKGWNYITAAAFVILVAALSLWAWTCWRERSMRF
ncbi:MAG: glycosyltransferase family 4 protein [Kiritimatiellae bacterium]|nr:glycosyltransferase family 4 protein [Kiritimatiellia bacterium]